MNLAPTSSAVSAPIGVVARADRTPEAETRWGILAAIAISLLLFAAIAPTLQWTQFHSSLENLNIATAMEMRRGGPLLVPSLQGEKRLAKPPLTAWLTAAAIDPQTMVELTSQDPAVRSAAQARLAFQVRWPTLAAACGIVFATFWLARFATGGGSRGNRIGLIAATACGTSLLFIGQCRFATTDVHLALWVAVANAALAAAVFRKRYSLSLPIAGAALGMAFMAKGPVALVQTVLPVLLFLWISRRVSFAGPPTAITPRRNWKIPLAIGLVTMAAVGLPWFIAVAATQENIWALWYAEVTRVDADEVPASPWYAHFLNLGQFGAWLPWIAVGAWIGLQPVLRRWREDDDPENAAPTASEKPRLDQDQAVSLLGVLLLLVPVLIMSLAKDRFDRYLLPLLPAGSLLAAIAVERVVNLAPWKVAHSLATVHLSLALAFAAGVPIAAAAGMFSLKSVDGGPLFSWGVAGALAAAAGVVIAAAIVASRRWPVHALWIGTLIAMTGGQIVYAHARSRSPAGNADLRAAAEILNERYPDAAIYALKTAKRNTINIHANTLSIYLNREAKWAPDIRTMELERGPVALVMTRGKNKPDPDTPAGWQLLLSTRGADKKFVFLKPRRNE
jgi:4-amino-4-deoxy-L-arabinose transferase-like glycosyltransferase